MRRGAGSFPLAMAALAQQWRPNVKEEEEGAKMCGEKEEREDWAVERNFVTFRGKLLSDDLL